MFLFLRFDLVANGGTSLTLRFERAPFLSQEHTVWLPWNRFYAMDTLVMKTEKDIVSDCDLSGFNRPDPVVVPSPLSSFFSYNPTEKHIIPESQVLIPTTPFKTNPGRRYESCWCIIMIHLPFPGSSRTSGDPRNQSEPLLPQLPGVWLSRPAEGDDDPSTGASRLGKGAPHGCHGGSSVSEMVPRLA